MKNAHERKANVVSQRHLTGLDDRVEKIENLVIRDQDTDDAVGQ
jgi:hypothetical protein